MTPTDLAQALYKAFEYTNDNNRDLVGDTSFPMSDTTEELFVQWAFQFLVAFILRNEEMIASNLQD